MPATVPSSSLAQSLQGKPAQKWSDQTALAGLISPGNQQPPSFSRTLQNQLRDSSAQSAQSAQPSPAQARTTRESERSPQRDATREPERPGTQAAGPAAESRSSEGTARPDDAARGSESPGEHAAASRHEQAAAVEAPAETPADAAGIAGLPAAIAALQTGKANDDTASTEPAADDNAGKGLQNAGLLSKGDSKLADPGTQANQASQGRLPVAAFIADKAATAAQPLKPGGEDITVQQPAGTGGHHGANLLGVLRHTPAPTPQLPVQTPVNRQAWAEDVGDQVRWMIGRAESKAELVLTPPNIGKLEVSISLSGDQTTAQFVASSQAARDALEQALPRLREILQQSGISLGQADVSTSEDRSAGSGGHDSGGQGRHTGGSGATAESIGNGSQPAAWLQQHDGLVDTFV
ncbi:flagellar hook-length control protein FliK [Thauera sp.]|uniref:flagellar hook-length control protein FliK n=1 Tax=Thauera sp. TaxID=1905334 RepID=UPI0039E44CBE